MRKKERVLINSASAERPPLLGPGMGRLRFLSSKRTEGNEKTGNESVIITFEVVFTTQENLQQGDEVQVIFVVNGKGKSNKRARLKMLAIRLAGWASEGEAREHDPEDDLTYDLLEENETDNEFVDYLLDRHVDYIATRGAELESQPGEYFTNITWFVAGDGHVTEGKLPKREGKGKTAQQEFDFAKRRPAADDDDDEPPPPKTVAKRRPVADDDDDEPPPPKTVAKRRSRGSEIPF